MNKKCATCGKVKSIDNFCVASYDRTKYRPDCKVCKAAKQRVQRKNAKLRDALIAKQTIAKPKAPDVVPPRTFTTTEVWVPRDRTFYRNDGLKHIQSRGV